MGKYDAEMIKMDNAIEMKPNRLIKEKSPYLLQHAYNPVDWYPWGDEAFEKAKAENKPVFLSIGYSTCHWCHVMEHDSFEDEEVAAQLNENYVSIKVDREERPDLDQKYMAACQALTGQGGWPLTVFLTPEKKPFYAGTFFPKKARYGINGMLEILPRLSAFWKEDRERVIKAGEELAEALRRVSRSGAGDSPEASAELPGRELLDRSYRQFEGSYDKEYAGFGQAPKFPAPHQLIFLLRYWKSSGEKSALGMAVETLRAMHRGGIFDQLGYGMHRYSVDSRWLVPHFEKMLYDQALTAIAALDAYSASGDEEMAELAGKIFTYVLNNLASPEGPFYAAEDADTEGEEGVFYVWRPEEFTALLGADQGTLAAGYFGVTEEGNFENGKSILHRPHGDDSYAQSKGISAAALVEAVEEARVKLLRARAARERPFLDDKFITSWNGLIIAALARGYSVLKRPEYLKAAERAAEFISAGMVSSEGRLLRRYREGEAAIPAFLDDYANLAWAHLELYRATAKRKHLEKAEKLTRQMFELFEEKPGLLNYSAVDQEEDDFPLEAEVYDGASPSGVSVAAMNLLRLGRMLPDEELYQKGEGLIAAQKAKLEQYPTGLAYMLAALDYALNPNEGHYYCTPDGSCGWE
jgi:uncharacterized protein